jgi:hypothetical protein
MQKFMQSLSSSDFIEIKELRIEDTQITCILSPLCKRDVLVIVDPLTRARIVLNGLREPGLEK